MDTVKRKTFDASLSDLQIIAYVMNARKENSFSSFIRQLIREEAKRLEEGQKDIREIVREEIAIAMHRGMS